MIVPRCLAKAKEGKAAKDLIIDIFEPEISITEIRNNQLESLLEDLDPNLILYIPNEPGIDEDLHPQFIYETNYGGTKGFSGTMKISFKEGLFAKDVTFHFDLITKKEVRSFAFGFLISCPDSILWIDYWEHGGKFSEHIAVISNEGF